MAGGLVSHLWKDDIIGNEDGSDDIGGGRLVSCHIFCVHTPQSSEFLSEVRANSKDSLPQGQDPANQIQLNSTVTGVKLVRCAIFMRCVLWYKF